MLYFSSDVGYIILEHFSLNLKIVWKICIVRHMKLKILESKLN